MPYQARFSLSGRTFSPNEWRKNYRSWNERVAHLYKTKYGYDLTLKVKSDNRETLFKTHRFVLSMSSDVLETIMNAEVFKNTKDASIVFTNVDEEAFGHFVKFLYTSSVSPNSTAQAIEIFRIADKFNVSDLAEQCYRYIEAHIDPSNVMNCYMFADVHGMDELKTRCSKLIQNNTKQVVNKENIMKFDVQSLIVLLNQPALSIRDFELFKLVERWIKVCEGSEICSLALAHNPTKELKKKFHNLLLTRFRHMSVSPEDLAKLTPASSRKDVADRKDDNPGSITGRSGVSHAPASSRTNEKSPSTPRRPKSGSTYRLDREGSTPPPTIGIQQVSTIVPTYISNKVHNKTATNPPRSRTSSSFVKK